MSMKWSFQRISLYLVTAGAVLAGGCTDKPTDPGDGGPGDGTYSSTVQRIFNRSCALSGCHGAGTPAAGLELTSWEDLFRGSEHGEVVVAFRPEESHLVDHLTGAAEPQMPYGRDPLPAEEIDLIRDWIAAGARNDLGAVPFADSRQKIFVTNQGSDQVTVLDAEALVTSRIIDVGVLPDADYPHNVFADPQGEHYYLSLINSARILKFDARTDSLLGIAEVGESPANPVTSPDGKTLYVTNWRPDNPTLHVLDATTLEERYMLRFPLALGASPHGLCVNADGSTLYTTHEQAGSVFKILLGETAQDAELRFIPLDGRDTQLLQPLQVVLDADERYAYVTCLNSGQVQVIDTDLEQVVNVIEIGGNPWLAALTPDGSRVYVANWGKNAVDVIDTGTRSLVMTIDNSMAGDHGPVFARPHGVAMSHDGRFAFVSNENTNGEYPPHHGGETSGNGNLVVIELATNHVMKTIELEVDPTGVAFAAH